MEGMADDDAGRKVKLASTFFVPVPIANRLHSPLAQVCVDDPCSWRA